MSVKTSQEKKTATAAYWKEQYEKQRFLVNSITSLLNRYGSSIELGQLYSTFLLTLMGQFVASDASYYSFSSGDRSLLPTLAYGRLKPVELPPVLLTSDQVDLLHDDPSPTLVENLPPDVAKAPGMKFVSSNYKVFAPLFLKGKLLGVLFLGDRVSGQKYKPTDLKVMQSLCSVSATTFNNAVLYENAKHSAREIQRLFEIRNEVISRISHEFRTPLTIIKAGIEIMEKNGDHTELGKLFAESETRLENLINSLLSLSQDGAGGDVSEVSIDPLAVLHDSIHRYSGAAGTKKIPFNLVQNAGVSPPVLHMKETDLRTILDALLENAIKFSPVGAPITIEIESLSDPPNVERDGERLPDWKAQTEDLIREYSGQKPDGLPLLHSAERPSLDAGGEYLVIRVSDNGIGIPEEDLMSVAEPFRQASNSPDLGVKGRGLGLALVHKVVSCHGGFLCCKSTEGEGTVFSVYLPIEGD
jgi:signal transduction histidine kinase